MSIRSGWTPVFLIAVALVASARAEDKKPDPAPLAPPKGLRVYTAGHSFHVFMPGILTDVARRSGIADHAMAGLSPIGGSRVIQHWNVADDKFKAKELLKAGKVDVLTLSPIYLPDEGIELFAKMGLEHNPDIRITVQANWLPFDVYDPTFKQRPAKVDHDAPSAEALLKMHDPYFKSVDDYVSALNKKLEKRVLFVVPVGQAVVALREKILAAGAPGLSKQSELFTDAIGHARPPIQALNAYCHFAVIYRRSPVGLKMPAVLERAKNPSYDPKLNQLLQELAWDAVTSHPLSGIKREGK